MYDFPEVAIDDINKFAKGQGYAVATFRTKTDKQTPPTVRKIWLRCAKGRAYTNTSRERLTSSRMTECPFEATLTRTPIRWGLEVKDPNHNHPAAVDPIALPQHRQRSYDINRTIADILGSSIGATKILTNLLKKDITISIQDIYNERKLNKKRLLGGLTPIQALIKSLSEHGSDDPNLKYYFAYKEDDSNRVKYLFFAHPELIKFFWKNPNILLLDCTYKTNKFKIPFLHAVGVSNTG